MNNEINKNKVFDGRMSKVGWIVDENKGNDV